MAEKVNPNKRNKNQAQALGEEQRIFGLVTIYSAAKQHFAYFEQVPGLDWDRAFKEYLRLGPGF
ncbi:MAG: hypothetical protein ACYS76_16105 [Planctomycetota bacterium]